jgi:hypothetical protein
VAAAAGDEVTGRRDSGEKPVVSGARTSRGEIWGKKSLMGGAHMAAMSEREKLERAGFGLRVGPVDGFDP